MEKLSQNHTLYRVKLRKPTGWVGRNDLRDELIASHGITNAKKLTTRMDAFNNRELKDLGNVHARLRKELEKIMLPWDERGFKIVSNSRIPQVEKLVSDAQLEGEDKLDIFIKSFAEHVDNDRVICGTAFREKDYPTEAVLRAKHSIEVDIALVPDPEQDVRAGWTNEMRVRHKKQILKQEKEKVSRAMLDAASRIQEHIKKIVNRVEGYTGKKDGSYKDSLIQNVRDMASMIQEFNLTNDPAMEAVYQKIVHDICTLDPKAMRGDKDLSNKAVENAKDILDSIGNIGRKTD